MRIEYERSFASHPKSEFWSIKNKLQPDKISKCSKKKYWFNCDKCNHDFEIILSNITYNNNWCSYCKNKKLCKNDDCEDCFNKSFASHKKSVYWSNKNELNPRDLFLYSKKLALFNCNKCNHVFETNIGSITNMNSWCNYCSNNFLCENEDCKDCFGKSFASHNKVEFWSNKNKLKPRQVFKSTGDKYLFDCNKCNHEFEIRLNSIITNYSWCPYCCIPTKKLCENNECELCFNKSFASHEKSIYWSNKNNIKPREIPKSSGKIFLFDCNNCNHEFILSLDSINSKNQWCQYCNSYKLCDNKNCKKCFNKSFASDPKVIYWSIKNDLKPREVSKFSDKNIIFNCNNCTNEYTSILSHKTGCTNCKHKTELKLFNWLKENYNEFTIEKQVKFEWCKNITYLPFDFYIKQLKLIIELDGPQHFKQISNWQSPEEAKKTDNKKNKLALDNGYLMIRICQKIVLFDKENWENQLKEAIKNNINFIKIGSVYQSV